MSNVFRLTRLGLINIQETNTSLSNQNKKKCQYSKWLCWWCTWVSLGGIYNVLKFVLLVCVVQCHWSKLKKQINLFIEHKCYFLVCIFPGYTIGMDPQG